MRANSSRIGASSSTRVTVRVVIAPTTSIFSRIPALSRYPGRTASPDRGKRGPRAGPDHGATYSNGGAMQKTIPQRSRLSLAVALAFTAGAAHAQANLPADGRVTAGSGTVSQTDATSMLIRQASDRLAMTWQSFSIGAGHSVRFDQPSASAIALNRVLGGNRSE